MHITGEYNGTVDFGGGQRTSTGNADIFVGSYRLSNGAYSGATVYGSAGFDRGYGIAVIGSVTFIVGQAQGPVDFGAGPLPFLAGYDGFIARLPP